MLCTILYPLILLWPSQPSRQAEYWSLAFEPLCLVLRTMAGINTYLSLEKSQCKFMYSASLPPWPPSSLWSSRCRWQTVLLQGGVGQGIAQVLHSHITTSPCLLLQRAGSSLSWWMAFCHLQLTYGHGCMRTKFPSPRSAAHRSWSGKYRLTSLHIINMLQMKSKNRKKRREHLVNGFHLCQIAFTLQLNLRPG